MASPSELSLDCKPDIVLKSFGDKTHDEKTQKLEEIISRLQEERLKIDAFKRELPLCMQLLTNAVETSKQQLQTYKENEHQGKTPVLEEFIIKNQHSNSEEKQEKIEYTSDKANWMTTAQLWCQTSANTVIGSNKNIQQSNVKTPKNTSFGFDIISPKTNLETKQRNVVAFLPFSKDQHSGEVTDLALSGSNETGDGNDNDNDRKGFEGYDSNNGDGVINEQMKSRVRTIDTHLSNGGNSDQNHRKARRCWSPDLHRRFVNALQMLGGSQVATPKQIRELMKVEGLTNDEVKSHLQKYRLHTRRPMCPNPQGGGTPQPQPQPQPQLVVLGGIWVPPEYASAHNGAPTMTTLYSAAHQVSHTPLHYCATPVASHQQHQDHLFYAHNHTSNNNNTNNKDLGQLLHVYNSPVQTRGSAGSGGRGNGDSRSVSFEDGKSGSYSGKEGESAGENGMERKGSVAFGEEDGEETNGSDRLGVTKG